MTAARRLAPRVALVVVVGAIALVFLFPFYWMAVSSVRTNGQIYSSQLNLLPRSITWKNYHDLFTTTLFFRWVLNSLIVSGGTVLLGIVFSTFAGFAFAKGWQDPIPLRLSASEAELLAEAARPR